MNKIKKLLRSWLGIESAHEDFEAAFRQANENRIALEKEVATLKRQLAESLTLGVDLHFSQPNQTKVVILSALNGGRVEILDLRFRTAQELGLFTRSLEINYGMSHRHNPPIIDGPPGLSEEFGRGRW